MLYSRMGIFDEKNFKVPAGYKTAFLICFFASPDYTGITQPTKITPQSHTETEQPEALTCSGSHGDTLQATGTLLRSPLKLWLVWAEAWYQPSFESSPSDPRAKPRLKSDYP